MKRLIFAAASLLTSLAVWAQESSSLPPEIPYRSVANFLKYPRDMTLGELSSVAVDSKGHVFAISRSNTTGPLFGAAATQIFEFDKNGKFVHEIARNSYGLGFGHSLRVDRKDRLWLVDKGTNYVLRFDDQDHVDLVLGRKYEATDPYEPPQRGPRKQLEGYFNQPTDVAWDAAGNIYVSDGYINSRIAKYDANGNWIKSWGTYGSQPGQFVTPHAIGIDANGLVYVADRSNARIQVFDGEGNFQRIIKISIPAPAGARPALTPPAVIQNMAKDADGHADPSFGSPAYGPGAPWTICITPPVPGKPQYLFTSDAFPGRIYKLSLDGKVVGMLGSAGRQLGQFNWIHGMACPNENELYVADLNNWRVQKLVLNPATP